MLRSRLSSKLSPLGLIGILAVLLATPACAQILGLGSFTNECGGEIDAPNVCKGGGGMTSNTTGGKGGTTNEGGGGNTGTAGNGGNGGAPLCVQGASCYTPGDDSYKNGICKQGKAQCNDDGTLKTCTGEVVPKTETCANTSDENCDGFDCALWAHLYGDVQAQEVGAVGIDSDGNFIIGGEFIGTIAFDPAQPLTTAVTKLFVAKFDPTGKPLWSKAYSISGIVDVQGIAVDSSQNIFMNGYLGGYDGHDFVSGGVNFGSNALSSNLGTYVAKFDKSGAFQWNAKYEETVDDFRTTPVGVDSSGHAVITGSTQTGPSNVAEIWIRKYNPDGTVQFTKKYPLADEEYYAPVSTITSFDEIVIGGSCAQKVDLGLGEISAHGFVALYNSNGAFQWADVITSGAPAPTSMAADAAGNIVMGGTFSHSMAFSDTNAISDGGDGAVFLASVSHDDGGTRWLKPYAGASTLRLSVDGNATAAISVAMHFSGVLNLGGAPLTGTDLTSLAFAKLGGDGSFIWQRLFQGAANPVALAAAPMGTTALAMPVSGKIDVGTGTLTPAGATDVFLGKFAQ